MRWPPVVGFTCLLAAAFTTAASATDQRPAAEDQPAGKRLRVEQMEPRPRPKDDAGPQGRAEAATLGVSIGPVPEELRAHVELPERRGLVITRVATGGPAEKAGLLPHDILLEFDGRGVASPLELTEMIDAAGVGARVRLGILRRGKHREITAVLGPRAAEADGDAAAAKRPGAAAGRELDAAAQGALAQALAMAQGGGTSVQVRSTVVNGVAEHSAVSRDRDGTIEIHARAGRKTVAIRGADGTEIHAGPLDAKADLDAVPAAWRERVRTLDGRITPPAAPWLPMGGS